MKMIVGEGEQHNTTTATKQVVYPQGARRGQPAFLFPKKAGCPRRAPREEKTGFSAAIWTCM